MSKLVYQFKHVRPLGIHIPGRGVIFPKANLDTMVSPFPDRPMTGFTYDLDFVHQVELLPEAPDELPASISGDADFVREFKLSQAKEVAENIKQNEALIRALQSHEDAGNIELLGRANVDNKGKVISKKVAEQVVASTVIVDVPTEDIQVAPRRAGRPKAKVE